MGKPTTRAGLQEQLEGMARLVKQSPRATHQIDQTLMDVRREMRAGEVDLNNPEQRWAALATCALVFAAIQYVKEAGLSQDPRWTVSFLAATLMEAEQ